MRSFATGCWPSDGDKSHTIRPSATVTPAKGDIKKESHVHNEHVDVVHPYFVLELSSSFGFSEPPVLPLRHGPRALFVQDKTGIRTEMSSLSVATDSASMSDSDFRVKFE